MDDYELNVAEVKRHVPDSMLEALLRWALDASQSMARDGTDSFTPMLILYGKQPSGEMGETFVPILKLDGQRYKLFEALGIDLVRRLYFPLAALFVSEAWLAEDTPDSIQPGAPDYVPPSQRPDRKEMLAIICQSIDRRTCATYLELTHDAQGNVILQDSAQAIRTTVSQAGVFNQSNLLDAFFNGVQLASKLKLTAQDLVQVVSEVADEILKSEASTPPTATPTPPAATQVAPKRVDSVGAPWFDLPTKLPPRGTLM